VQAAVLIFSLIVLLLGIVSIAIGVMSLSLIHSFLADLISDHISYACIAAGATLFIISALGCSGACYSKTRKCSLVAMTFFTFIVFICSIASFVVVFEYERVVSYAAEHNFTLPDGQKQISGAEEMVYNEIKSGFTKAFDNCEPVVYNTATLIASCEDQSNATTECFQWEKIPPEKNYMYCNDDKPASLVLPRPKITTPESDMAKHGFGWWVSSYCLSTLSKSAGFDECYNTTWWAPADLKEGVRLFDFLPPGESMNSKSAFCYCQSSAEGSSLWRRIKHYSGIIKWVSLGMVIFFLFSFVAGCYLICCRKKELQDYYGKKKDTTTMNGVIARP